METKDNTIVEVNGQWIAQWRLDQRPDKTLAICPLGEHSVKWEDNEQTLRCQKCGLDCT